MFTGIVEETGSVKSIQRTKTGTRLVIQADIAGRQVQLGDSIAVNGCCLTVVKMNRSRTKPATTLLHFDLLKETWERTNLQFLNVADAVNLERALSAGSRMGGHWVTGHIDGTGVIRKWQVSGADRILEIDVPPELQRLMVPKGSVTVDGISLTVAAVLTRGIRIWIIPHTTQVTNVKHRKVGDRVNLEGDLIGKYVARYWDQWIGQVAEPGGGRRLAGKKSR